MISIHHVILEAPHAQAAAAFYRDALLLDDRIRLEESDSSTSGFRGFTLGLDVADPSQVDQLVAAAVEHGAVTVKPAQAQQWGGYSGVVQTPDGVVVKVATSGGREHPDGSNPVERVVLLLGVESLGASKEFYTASGLSVEKDFGRYVEFAQGSGAVTLALYERPGLAGEFGVSPEGSGSHRVMVASTGASFTDPDGFAWTSAGGMQS